MSLSVSAKLLAGEFDVLGAMTVAFECNTSDSISTLFTENAELVSLEVMLNVLESVL